MRRSVVPRLLPCLCSGVVLAEIGLAQKKPGRKRMAEGVRADSVVVIIDCLAVFRLQAE